MINIQGLSKTYESGLQAVKNLNLEIKDGEILALLGPNGAGKSTTIRILTTLSGFDEGSVTIAGHDVDREPELVRQAIGYVAQDTGIDYFLTGRENLRLHGQMYRMTKRDIKARIEELAEYFELSRHLDTLVSAYSGGMRRKLDIATALMHRPKVLFLDEPTLGLDTKSRQNLWRYIEKLNIELGLTILLTTHYLDEADKLSSRVAIIDQGEIKALDTAETLKTAIQGDVVSMEFADESDEMQNFSWQLRQHDYVKDATWESDKYHLYVTNGAEAIPKVIQAATGAGITVKNISFARPTLDDVFIKHTGSSLQGDKEEGGEEWWHQWAGKGGGSGKWAKQWQKWQSAEEEESADNSQDWKKWQQGIGQESESNDSEQQWPQQAQWQNSKNSGEPPEWPNQGEWQAGEASPESAEMSSRPRQDDGVAQVNSTRNENDSQNWPDPSQWQGKNAAGEHASWSDKQLSDKSGEDQQWPNQQWSDDKSTEEQPWPKKGDWSNDSSDKSK
ncbi:MAG: ATP-binding cassette domain-containing protein [Gammaproteobacteria bacterium]|nr:ATP-binding cassette domain-containing protein [Gammaproteobacteria bacterium]